MQQSGLYILGDLSAEPLPVVLNDAFGAVAFWGLPYANPASVCSALNVPVTTHNEAIKILSQGLIKQSKQSRNVVLSHCFIDGASESESERPLSIGGADRVDW